MILFLHFSILSIYISLPWNFLLYIKVLLQFQLSEHAMVSLVKLIVLVSIHRDPYIFQICAYKEVISFFSILPSFILADPSKQTNNNDIISTSSKLFSKLSSCYDTKNLIFLHGQVYIIKTNSIKKMLLMI